MLLEMPQGEGCSLILLETPRGSHDLSRLMMWHVHNNFQDGLASFMSMFIFKLDHLWCLTPTACEVRKEPRTAAFGLLDYGCACYTQLTPKLFETLQTLHGKGRQGQQYLAKWILSSQRKEKDCLAMLQVLETLEMTFRDGIEIVID